MVFKVNKNGDYTVMSNIHFKEKNMSLKAKGLLSLMLSLPEDWDYSIAGLVKISKDGKDSVMKALQELEQYGYLKRTKVTDDKGRFEGYQYDIYESPYSEKPYAEKPNTEKPNTENPPQLNTNLINNSNNKILINKIVEYLNEKAGTHYKATTKNTQKHINQRLSEGYTFESFKAVIDKKCTQWKGTDFEQYLCPDTLFGTKFEKYLNQPTQSAPKWQSNSLDIMGV